MKKKVQKNKFENLNSSKIGILGGGQLGKMIAESAKRLGYHTVLYCPPGDNPAEKVVNEYISGSWNNIKKINEFSRKVAVATSEFENIPANVLELISKKTMVYPSSYCFNIAQLRNKEKTLAREAGFLVPKWFKIKSFLELKKYSNDLNYNCILKTNSQGYDGKGQKIISSNSDLNKIWKEINFKDCVLEEKIKFDREISILYARSLDGSQCFFPISENHHENGILRKTIAPISLNKKLRNELEIKVKKFADLINLNGILTIELFECKEKIIFNEIAPRPHNSYHWTIEGCENSQFDILVKCLFGQKISAQRVKKNWTMVNILGDEINNLDTYNYHSKQKIHIYGKKEIKKGRKMGHITYPNGKSS